MISAILVAFLLAGCVANPLMTNKPQDWLWHPAEELRQAWGDPSRTYPQENGEIWEYRKTGRMLAPETSETHFGAGTVPFHGVQGNARTVTNPGGLAEFENLWRFLVHDGKVRKWYAARMENGRVVWEDH